MIFSLVFTLMCLAISFFPIINILFLISLDKLIKYYNEKKSLD
jgi:uncharacterized membrane protein